MKLNSIFTSRMVFNAFSPIRIFGEGEFFGDVTFAGKTKKAINNGDNWIVEFEPMEYGGPYELKIEDLVLTDIYVGKVLLFSGQSNIQFKMFESKTPDNLIENNDMLRVFNVNRLEKGDKYTEADGWLKMDNRDCIDNTSALGYLVGNKISKEENIAVGVITSCQGASVIEAWVENGLFLKNNINIADEFKHNDHFDKDYIWNEYGKLYDEMIKRFFPFSIDSVIWYQGEADATVEEGKVYHKELSLLIDLWRKGFENDDLKFIIVQLADLLDENIDIEGWREVQNSQLLVSKENKNVLTVISKDVCENNEIHPPTKYKLADRIVEKWSELNENN